MALISAKTIITSVSLFHITIAYFFLTSPSTVDNQALVYILGESMGMVSSYCADICVILVREANESLSFSPMPEDSNLEVPR